MIKKYKAKKQSRPSSPAPRSQKSELYDSDLHTGKMFMARIRQAQKTKEKWENKFKCAKLEEYYEGQQWKDMDNYVPYVLNLFYSTIEIKNPALLFRNPTFYCAPTPGGFDFDPETAFHKATLATDTVNTLISNPNTETGIEIQHSLLESMFRFGMMEVGYGATWIDNPNASKPIHEDQYEPDLKNADDTTTEPDKIPEEEHVYLKSIQAHRVLLGGWAAKTLEKTNWVAYYEYIPLKDIEDKSLGLRHVDDIVANSSKSSDYVLDEDEDLDLGTGKINDNSNKGDLAKFWHIFDNRAKKRYLLHEGTELTCKEVLYPGPKGKQRLQLLDLRFSLRTKGWLPIPYTYNWKSCQDEQNEGLEQIRAARRRTKRVFTQVGESVEEEEQAKLLSGPDGVVIKTSQQNAIQPLEFGRLDPVIGQTLQLSMNNFRLVSGATTQDQGLGDRTTATEANITNTRAGIRENKDREIVAQWLCDIAREVLLTAIDNFTLPTWVMINSDSKDSWGQEYGDIQKEWKQIKTDELAGIDFKVSIEVDTMSPVANDIEKNKFLNFMAVMNQFPQLSLNPVLIREAAFRLDYRNEKVIKAFQQAAMLQMMGQAAQQGGQSVPPGGVPPQQAPNTPMAQRTAEQAMPPEQSQIENQMASQGVPK